MINVGILGGDTRAAGELIRILINHPDVILRAVAALGRAGMRIDSFHRGLVGDTDLCFSSALDTSKLNCVFLLGERWQARDFVAGLDVPAHRIEMDEDSDTEEGLRVIDLTGAFLGEEEGMVYGFPEFHRKAMVRGALRASLPPALTVAIELALFPLAKNHLLGPSVTASAELPRAAANVESSGNTTGMHDAAGPDAASMLSTRLDPIAPAEHRLDEAAAVAEAERDLRRMDACYQGKIALNISASDTSTRGIKVKVDVDCTASPDEVARLIEETYSDHNFAFLIDREPEIADIANTNKCLLRVEPRGGHGTLDSNFRSPSTATGVRVTAVIDDLIKGASGNAVHCMNLLFGLSERTGLALKSYEA